MTPIEIAALIVAVLLAAARLFRTAAPLYSWLPEKLQPVIPAVVVVLPQIAQAFGAVQTKLDLIDTLLFAIAVVAAAVRGTPVPARRDEIPPPRPPVA